MVARREVTSKRAFQIFAAYAGQRPSRAADTLPVADLILGSTGASCRPRGIAASDLLHAVRATDCATLCGAPVVFVFLETEFPGPDLEVPICPQCHALAMAATAADSAVA
jgi:hypothetical protein